MIYVVAYFNKNLGDDLFVRTLVRRYPNENFYVCENKQNLGDLVNEKNIKYNNYLNYTFLRIINKFRKEKSGLVNKSKMKNAKALVRIGGSIFMEMDGWKNNRSRYNNDNIFYIGANFGPYKTNEYKEEVKNKLRNSINCCFRDKFSFELFNNLENVSYAPDVLFGYPDFPVEKKGNIIGISVINLVGRNKLELYTDKYEEGIVKLCRHYLSLGKKVSLLGFCEPEGDNIAIQRIMDRVGSHELLSSICYDGRIDEFLNEMNNCETIYASRFHAMILGFVMKKKVIPIIYSRKQTHVLEDLNYSGAIWDLLSGEDLPNNCLDTDPCLVDDDLLRFLISESQKQFCALDLYLLK